MFTIMICEGKKWQKWEFRIMSRSRECASYHIQLPKSFFSNSVISVFSGTTRFCFVLWSSCIIWFLLHVPQLCYWVNNPNKPNKTERALIREDVDSTVDRTLSTECNIRPYISLLLVYQLNVGDIQENVQSRLGIIITFAGRKAT